MALIKALTGGRDPKHGDSILFVGQGADKDLGWIFSPTVLNADNGGEDDPDGDGSSVPPVLTWESIVGVPDTFPAEEHIHASNLNVINHGTDGLVPRVDGYTNTLWVGPADPFYAEESDFWVNI